MSAGNSIEVVCTQERCAWYLRNYKMCSMYVMAHNAALDIAEKQKQRRNYLLRSSWELVFDSHYYAQRRSALVEGRADRLVLCPVLISPQGVSRQSCPAQ